MAIEDVGRLEGNRSSSLLNHTFSSQVDGSTRDLRPFPLLHVAVRQIQDRWPVRPRASNCYAARSRDQATNRCKCRRLIWSAQDD